MGDERKLMEIIIFSIKKVKKAIFYIKVYGIKGFIKKLWNKILWEIIFKKMDISHIPKLPELNLPITEEKILTYEDATVSVVIPTKNGGDNLGLLLSIIKRQKGVKKIEIIVVDSGSKDETVQLAKKFGAKIIEIPPEKFTHSYARNIGAENSLCKYIFFTAQDALLPSELFFYNILSILKNNKIDVISCTEFPREDSDLFYNVVIWNHIRFLELEKNDRIISLPFKKTWIEIRKNCALSNIATFIPKELFMKYKFRYEYGEDLDLGIRVINDGYKIGLLSSNRIIHSHNRDPYYFLKRLYTETFYWTKIIPGYPLSVISRKEIIQDLFHTYNFVNSLIKEINRIKTPIPVKELFTFIGKKVNSFESTISFDYNEYSLLDNNLKSLLKEISEVYPIYKGGSKYYGTLLSNVWDFLNTAKEYLFFSFPVIDNHLVEDFKLLLIKTYAIKCGEYLAYYYLNEGELIKGLHNRLREGV